MLPFEVTRDMNRLLAHAARLRAKPHEPTVLEIAGQSEKELVWSRLLAHHLRPDLGHSFSVFFLDALLSAAGVGDPPGEVQLVELEVFTEAGFIDLVVTTEKLIIGIENKVHSWVHNDLADYQNHLRLMSRLRGRETLAILLTLRPESVKSSGFVNVSWAEVIRRVRTSIAGCRARPHTRADDILQEFVAMVDNVTEGKRMDREFAGFVASNEQGIKALQEGLAALKSSLVEQATQFQNAIAGRLEEPSPQRWFREDLSAIVFFEIPSSSGSNVVVDVSFGPRGAEIQVFARRARVMDQIRPLLLQSELKFHGERSGRLIWREYEVDSDMRTLVDDVLQLITQIRGIPPLGSTTGSSGAP